MLTPATPSFIASGAIPAGARVKFVAGDPTKVQVAGVNEAEIGTAILHCGKDSYADGTAVGVKLLAEAGGRHVIAAGVIALGASLLRAANGKVDDGGAGTEIGLVAVEAATADGDIIEAIPCRPAATQVTLQSTNGTAGAAVDLTALKAEAEKIGDDVRAIHAALVTKGILSV